LPDYRIFYDAGVDRSAHIGFNYSTFEVLISDGSPAYPFVDVFRTIEDYLSTSQGVMFDYPPFPVVIDTGNGSRRYLFFPYDIAQDQVNPVRIRPNPANTTDPTLPDFVTVLEGAEAPLFDIFDFSLAGGRTLRFQTEAIATSVQVSGSGALTADQAAQLLALYNATEMGTGETVFSETALGNGGGGSGDGLTQADRDLLTQIGLDCEAIARGDIEVELPNTLRLRRPDGTTHAVFLVSTAGGTPQLLGSVQRYLQQ
jgi:hypothetical protein